MRVSATLATLLAIIDAWCAWEIAAPAKNVACVESKSMGTFGRDLLLAPGCEPECALCLSLPLIPMLVSGDSAMGLLCGLELLDALRGTTFGETAGIW